MKIVHNLRLSILPLFLWIHLSPVAHDLLFLQHSGCFLHTATLQLWSDAQVHMFDSQSKIRRVKKTRLWESWQQWLTAKTLPSKNILLFLLYSKDICVWDMRPQIRILALISWYVHLQYVDVLNSLEHGIFCLNPHIFQAIKNLRHEIKRCFLLPWCAVRWII